MKEDSIEGIYDTLKECAVISKSAGGIGLSVHNIRATSSYIRGTNGTSNGIIPMLRVFNDTARYVDQGGGKRKGAFAVYLEPWHADVFDWLDLRKNHGKVCVSCCHYCFSSFQELGDCVCCMNMCFHTSCLALATLLIVGLVSFRRKAEPGTSFMAFGYPISSCNECKAMASGHSFALMRLQGWRIAGVRISKSSTRNMKLR